MVEHRTRGERSAADVIAAHGKLDLGFRCECGWEVDPHVSITYREHESHVLAELEATGYAVVKLPPFEGDDGVNRAWRWVSRWWAVPPNEPRVVSMHNAPRLMSVEDARCLATQLWAAAAAREADNA